MFEVGSVFELKSEEELCKSGKRIRYNLSSLLDFIHTEWDKKLLITSVTKHTVSFVGLRLKDRYKDEFTFYKKTLKTYVSDIAKETEEAIKGILGD